MLETLSPTAVHAPLVEHATAARELDVAPLGLGVLCTAQLVPFQRSTSVSWSDPLEYTPAAKHIVADGQAAP